jgi:hypothetical protein
VEPNVPIDPPLASAVGVLRTAMGICRRRAGTLALIGLVLFTPLAAIEAGAVGLVHDGFEGDDHAVAIGVYLWVSLLMFGSAMCAGLVDTVVGHEFGEEDIELRRAIRELPYAHLIAVDVAQALVIGTASLLGFVPGLIGFTLTCLAGSLVVIERLPGRTALRRSVELTRRRVGLTFLVVTIPVAVEHQVINALGAWLGPGFVALWLLHAVFAIVVLVPVVVIEITLARALIHDQGLRRQS